MRSWVETLADVDNVDLIRVLVLLRFLLSFFSEPKMNPKHWSQARRRLCKCALSVYPPRPPPTQEAVIGCQSCVLVKLSCLLCPWARCLMRPAELFWAEHGNSRLGEPPSHLTQTTSQITPIYYSSFHFLFHYPKITPIYYSSCQVLFHFPKISPILYTNWNPQHSAQG